MSASREPLDWDAIETVLLDLDGTLLDLRFDNWFWQEHVPEVWARTRGVSLAAAQAALAPRFAARAAASSGTALTTGAPNSVSTSAR